MVAACEGDARAALTTVEVAVALARARGARTPRPGCVLTMDDMARARDGRLFHQGADEHYDQISALIKSVRGSDPDAGLYWMARMIEAGEDPRFLARRMVILASEDIGLADPQALLVAEAAARAVEYVGLPEAALNLAEAVIYLARAPKSNAVVVALGRAQADVRSSVAQEVPTHLRDAHYKGAADARARRRATSTPMTTPPGWSRSSIVLTRSRVGCTTSRRPRRCGRRRRERKPGQGGRFVNRGSAGRPSAAGARRWRRPRWRRRAGCRERRPSAVAAAAGAAPPGRVVLPQAAPQLPAGADAARRAPRPTRCSTSTSSWPGQNPAGLAQAVAAVSTPGSPDYRHYLTSAQFAAAYGPSPAEVAQVVLRPARRGAHRGHARPGQHAAARSAARRRWSRPRWARRSRSVQAPGERPGPS